MDKAQWIEARPNNAPRSRPPPITLTAILIPDQLVYADFWTKIIIRTLIEQTNFSKNCNWQNYLRWPQIIWRATGILRRYDHYDKFYFADWNFFRACSTSVNFSSLSRSTCTKIRGDAGAEYEYKNSQISPVGARIRFTYATNTKHDIFISASSLMCSCLLFNTMRFVAAFSLLFRRTLAKVLAMRKHRANVTQVHS